MEKSCVICGKVFQKKKTEGRPYFEKKKYCGLACSSLAGREKKKELNRPFIPWNKDMKYDENMKSRLNLSGLEVGHGFFKGKKRPEASGEKNSRWSGRTEKACLGCGISMSLAPWQMKRMYCSHTCDKQHRLSKRVQRDTKECELCKTVFVAPQPKARFCSKQCRGAYLATKFKGRPGYRPKDSYVRGEEHPSWKGGKASSIQELRDKCRALQEYKDWHAAILRRDGWKCVVCSHDRKLEVDHIVSFKEIVIKNSLTDTKMAIACAELWDLKNGRTLCRPCHKATPNHGRKKTTQD